MMYILYLNHGNELKAKALQLIWCFLYRVDTGGYGAKLGTLYILEHHVKMQINKIPQLAMHCNVKEMGA